MARVKVYPSPAKQGIKLKNRFAVKEIPGSPTSKKYKRADLGCLPGGAGHGGIDIPGSVGNPAIACIGGKISLKDFGPAFGKDAQVTIIAANENGQFNENCEGFFYAHLDQIFVQEGQIVNAGDQIGNIGMKGQVTGPHIHFEHRLRWGDWCTAVNCFSELERARTPINIRIKVGTQNVSANVDCYLNETGRAIVEVAEFLKLLKLNGQDIQFQFQNSPPRLDFSHPSKTTDFPVEIISKKSYAIVREMIKFIAPQATVTLDRQAKRLDIQGGGLTL